MVARVPRRETHLTIGRLAERSGVATSALRYYESRGLIRSERTAGNQRRYATSMLRRVAFIRSAQRVGLTLEEVEQALATLPAGRTPTKADWTRLSRSWRPRIDEQIARLERLRDSLDGCIGCGCLSLRSCRLSNPDDEMAPRGPGAVLLEPARDG
jgi:MerR family transcriptional regulator, redox-sensitive transcriptional activator SoxR